jgi:hypothetical protein
MLAGEPPFTGPSAQAIIAANTFLTERDRMRQHHMVLPPLTL